MQHHAFSLKYVVDILQGIDIQEHQIGNLSLRYGSSLIQIPVKTSRTGGQATGEMFFGPRWFVSAIVVS